MSDFTMPEDLTDALTRYFLPKLYETEDFQSFETSLVIGLRLTGAHILKDSLESFDKTLVENKPEGWSVHAKERRSLVTLVGRIEFFRTCFKDEYGRRRLLLDELLAIPERALLSQGAYLWVVKQASEMSYRKVARQFTEHTGAYISHVSVMHAVHEQGRLLKHHRYHEQKISHHELCVEVDGVWIHLQSPHHRKVALPRVLYEQARKTQSFELKVACFYAGKTQNNNRICRVGLGLSALDGSPDAFWENLWQEICSSYEEQDIEHIHVGADGASWCMDKLLTELMSTTTQIDYHLDLFHLTQAIAKAYPKGPVRTKARQLLFSGKAHVLAKASDKIASVCDNSARKDKLKALSSYITKHLDAISKEAPSLGTMEGTIAHVVAPRLKRQGRSWSRQGAEAMVLIRCALASDKELIAPMRNPYFSEREIEIKNKALQKHRASSVALTEGKGYEYPHQVLAQSLSSRANYFICTAP